MNQDENSQFCTISDAAKRTGLTRKTWYQGGAGTDRVPRVKFGRSVRLLRADLDKFIGDLIGKASQPAKDPGSR